MKLDIACGGNKKEGFTGIDIASIPGVDIVHDLTVYPWPIESESIEEVWCSHYIEHVQDIMTFMNEVYRVMKKEAQATFISPYYTSVRAWQDPTHVRPISEESYLYYNKAWRDVNNLGHYPITCDFDLAGWGHAWRPEYANRAQEHKDFAKLHYFNVIDDLYAVLKKR
jgi:hypothetical protein